MVLSWFWVLRKAFFEMTDVYLWDEKMVERYLEHYFLDTIAIKQSKIISFIRRIDWRAVHGRVRGCACGYRATAHCLDEKCQNSHFQSYCIFFGAKRAQNLAHIHTMHTNQFSWSRRCFLTTWLLVIFSQQLSILAFLELFLPTAWDNVIPTISQH